MIYRVLQIVLWPIFRLFYRFSVSNRSHIPVSGPVLLVANHTSYLDPVLLGLASRRPIAFMAKAELFKIPGLGWLIRRLYAFPVQREGFDRRAVRTALNKLKEGGVVGIFPQGSRERGETKEGLPGAALIALKSGAQILPAAILGADKVIPDGKALPRRATIEVRFGEPIQCGTTGEKKEIIEQMTRKIMEEIRTLLDEPA